MNEEEVKIKYVLPWLKQAGVDVNDLQFEQSFSVKIGRHHVSVGEPRAKSRAGARLDILVRRGGRNVLIVETKAANESLTEDDRDQAVFYARFVHLIAPYALVTNGNEYHLYDSITKDEIQPDAIRIREFELAPPEAAIAEAQKCYLGLNRADRR